jgi:hypothetical protein
MKQNSENNIKIAGVDKNRLCFICPSKSRIEELERLISSFIENSTIADLYIVIDRDDVEYSNHFTNDVIEKYKEDQVFFIINLRHLLKVSEYVAKY